MITSKTIQFLATAAFVVGFSTLAQAQATRTWVSGVGDDVNPCSRTAPCKTFAGAISKTAPNGEISVLDPGGFGTITITKSITLNGTGTLAGILSANTNGVNVNDSATGTPNTAVVVLRDISINGGGSGLKGVNYISGKSVTVDHCWIYSINGGALARGIDVAKSADGNLEVINSVIENVNEDGVHVTTSGGTVVALIHNSSILNCGQDGIEAVTNVRGEITHSIVEVMVANGIMTSGTNSQLNIGDTIIAHCNTTGLRASSGSSIRVSDSIIANNSTGISANGGTMDSFQGNSLIGNPTPGSFTTTTAKQ